MTNYYFLANSLPPLQIDTPPEMSLVQFRRLVELNISRRDMHQIAVMRRYYDIRNLRLFWLKQELDYRGNFLEPELEEALVAQAGFPQYVYDFLDKYDTTEARLHHFAAVLAAFYQHEKECTSGFLRHFLKFEREWRLVLLGFRAKKLKRDLATELQYEDSTDTLVAQMLAQKDATSYHPPYRYEDLKPLFEEWQDDPIGLHKALCEYRFHRIEDFIEGENFSIDFILGYLAQLIIVEKWQKLDKQQGKGIVKTIIQRS